MVGINDQNVVYVIQFGTDKRIFVAKVILLECVCVSRHPHPREGRGIFYIVNCCVVTFRLYDGDISLYKHVLAINQLKVAKSIYIHRLPFDSFYFVLCEFELNCVETFIIRNEICLLPFEKANTLKCTWRFSDAVQNKHIQNTKRRK